MVPYNVLKNFIIFIALSTLIRKFATSCFLNLRLCHLAFHSCNWWNNQSSKNEEANLLEFENPCLPLHHHLFLVNQKTLLSLVINLSLAWPPLTRVKRYKPSGRNFNQKFKCVMVLVVWQCSSMSRWFWSFNKPLCTIFDYMTFCITRLEEYFR